MVRVNCVMNLHGIHNVSQDVMMYEVCITLIMDSAKIKNESASLLPS